MKEFFKMIKLWNFLRLHIFGRRKKKKKERSFRILLKLKWQCWSWKKYYKSGGGKSERECVVSTERGGGGERTELEGGGGGQRKWPSHINWGEVTTVMGPVSTSSPTPFTVTALYQAWAVWQKIQLFRLKLCGASRVWQAFCLTALSSDWQNRPAAGWKGGRWK